MNDEQISEETDDTAVALPTQRSSALALGLLTLISLLALGISVLVYFQLGKIRQSSSGVPALFSQHESTLKSVTKTLQIVEEEKRNLQQELRVVEQQQKELSASLLLLSQQEKMGKEDWKLAEIEYLLIIAIHRLQLEGDVFTALAAMQAADDRLRDKADPRLLGLRQQITRDMNALKAVKRVDVTGLVLFLSDLVVRVADLPLQQAKAGTVISDPSNKADVTAGKWQQLKSAIWQELKDLVVISRRGKETLATLMPEQQYFLYQNLRLQLESARYAVLRRDTATLQASLEIITAWLNSYFDHSDNGVANILDSLRQMQSLELSPELPDISSSLEILHGVLNKRDESFSIIEEKPVDLEQ